MLFIFFLYFGISFLSSFCIVSFLSGDVVYSWLINYSLIRNFL
nr:MAG TPA: PsbA, PsbB, PsbC, PsbD, PsbE-FCP supercomplex, PLANT PROTEIN [Caudoviricetes sp.]